MIPHRAIELGGLRRTYRLTVPERLPDRPTAGARTAATRAGWATHGEDPRTAERRAHATGTIWEFLAARPREGTVP